LAFFFIRVAWRGSLQGKRTLDITAEKRKGGQKLLPFTPGKKGMCVAAGEGEIPAR